MSFGTNQDRFYSSRLFTAPQFNIGRLEVERIIRLIAFWSFLIFTLPVTVININAVGYVTKTTLFEFITNRHIPTRECLWN